MRQAITIRMDPDLLRLVEEVRDHDKFPTLSDFVRQAVVQYVREMRRRQLEEECRRLADEDLRVLAEADLADHVDRLGRAERGDL